MSKAKTYDGVKIHFDAVALSELERSAKSMSRMDLTEKMKLINQSRYANVLKRALERIAAIENSDNCGDWDEIIEARGIANEALGK